jgi:hypothetical protein
MLQLMGHDLAPVLGTLSRAARNSIGFERDISILGEDLVNICETLLISDGQWISAQNEFKFFLSQAEAANYLNGLVADSGARFLTEPYTEDFIEASLPLTSNLVVMIEVMYEGDSPELKTSLSTFLAMKQALEQLIDLENRHKLREIYVHSSPARQGDELTMDNVQNFFPELICL